MMSTQATIGILALQGAFDLHRKALKRLGVPHRLVKTTDDLAEVDALIIPGGESTTMRWFFQTEDLTDDIAWFVSTKPVMGTCAGMIMIAKNIVNTLDKYSDNQVCKQVLESLKK